jgi:hypothetical protein
MNIENYKHLFVPVGEGLVQGQYVTLVNGEFIKIQILIVIGNSRKWAYENTTHILYLSTLTTKKKAIELAEKAFEAGLEYDGNNDNSIGSEQFINEHKTLL